MAGGKVLLSEGEFTLADPLTIATSGVQLVGQGAATIITPVDGYTSFYAIFIDTTAGDITDLLFADFAIDGNRAGVAAVTTWGFSSLTTNDIVRSIWRNLYLHTFKGNAISLNAHESLLDNIHIDDADTSGLVLTGAAKDTSIRNCLIENTILAGITIPADAGRIVIGGCRLLSCQEGINHTDVLPADGPGVTISDCIIVDSTSRGIVLSDVVKDSVQGCLIDGASDEAIWLLDSKHCVIAHNRIRNTTGIGIRVTGAQTDGHVLIGNRCWDDRGGGAAMTYGIRLAIGGGAGNCVVIGNNLSDATTTNLDDDSTASIVRDNKGHVTENSGTATLLNGQVAIVVTHGLDVTPAAGDIMVTPMESLGAASEFYIDTYTATQFTIHVDVNPTQDVDFAWKAVVL